MDHARRRSLDLKERTLQFAEDVVGACRAIPKTFEGRHVSSQLFRASTSVAANYRAARRSRSKKEFIAKIGLVVEEADESLFWLEFAMRIKMLHGADADRIRKEANELVAIFYATRNTATHRLTRSNPHEG
jgi:four helix bundle protein